LLAYQPPTEQGCREESPNRFLNFSSLHKFQVYYNFLLRSPTRGVAG
jgi:hypothetical protein